MARHDALAAACIRADERTFVAVSSSVTSSRKLPFDEVDGPVVEPSLAYFTCKAGHRNE